MNPYLNTTLRNVIWFKNAHDKNELDMKPPFQRNPVWVDRQKSFLIDSILSGFPIPEIYMQEIVTGEGVSKHIVVDGQQRIRAVLEFLEGAYAINSKDTPSWGDMYFDDLSESDKKKIFTYNFIVRILPDIDDVLIRSMFQRLNRNVLALNKQELRQATYWGSFINLMNNLSNKEIWQKINIFTQNDIRRMIDVEFISELTIAFLHGPQNKKDKLENYYQIYEEEFEEEQLVEDVFYAVLAELNKILSGINRTRWRKKTDFYTLFLTFATRHENFPLSKEKKELASGALVEFGGKIDRYVKAIGEVGENFDENVKKYGSGIRASTDLSSRKRRSESLDAILAEVWE